MTLNSPVKITALALSLISTSVITNAQISKGSTYLGGQLSYNSSKSEGSVNSLVYENKNGNFNISVGRAVKENAILGVNVTYAPGSYSNYYNGVAYQDAKFRNMNYGVFYRQYKKLLKDFYCFAEVDAFYINGHQTVKNTTDATQRTINSNGGMVALMPGLSYRIFKCLYVDVSIPNIVSVQYSVSKDKGDLTNEKQETFGFNSSLSNSALGNLAVGFHFIF